MEDSNLIQSISTAYREKFDGEPLIVRSPGRVNIIGEHTDYNEGFVLPAAIDKAIYVAVAKSGDDLINLYSQEFNEHVTLKLSELARSKQLWANYILGVVDQLIKRGFQLGGFNLVVHGNVPIGSGLSSSAAVECSTAFALNRVFNLGVEKIDLVKIAQKAEHEYAGVLCGIMDQFASVFGKKDHVIKLDCRSLDFEYVPFDLKGLKILLLNTNVKHSLASTEYNTRREQCEQGVVMVQQHVKEVRSLRDVSMAMLTEFVAPLDAVIFRRCKYVLEENQRLQEGCQDLLAGDIAALGKKMFASHKGLKEDYEVSCKELDFLVEEVLKQPAVIGGRMMGGGFGGCTINLVRQDAIEGLVEELSQTYTQHMQLDLSYYIADIEDGTTIL